MGATITDKKFDENPSIEATQYVKRVNIVPGQTNENIFSIAILVPLAKLLVGLYVVYSWIVFYIHQASYFYQRQFVFNNRTPQSIRDDVSNLSKIPRHVGFVLEFPPQESIERLVGQAFECVLWSLGIGSQQVTLYERSGALKAIPLDKLLEAISTGLVRHFRDSMHFPSIEIKRGQQTVSKAGPGYSASAPTLSIILASERDGRPMLVSLAGEYGNLINEGKLKESDITVSKIHEELCERVGDEPDLLVTFKSHLDFAGFSPWLLRVTELFCLPDNNGHFHYLVFIKALQKFANVKINLGA